MKFSNRSIFFLYFFFVFEKKKEKSNKKKENHIILFNQIEILNNKLNKLLLILAYLYKEKLNKFIQ